MSQTCRFATRLAVVSLFALLISCDEAPEGATSPEQSTPEVELLGREIGETYLTLLEDAQALVELNLPAEQLRPALGRLRDDYRVRFANLGCVREELAASEKQAVERAAADYIDSAGPLDAGWLRQATARYSADAEVVTLLTDVQALQVYAFFDQLEETRPGETPVCGG
jgi:hypothetical protein